MDRATKKAITWVVAGAVGPVAADLAWHIYKGVQLPNTPIPLIFMMAVSTSSSSATMTMVDRKS
jgi:hypothetical protein